MFKILFIVAVIYCVVGVVVEVKAKKGEKLEFNIQALKRVVTWPWILFTL